MINPIPISTLLILAFVLLAIAILSVYKLTYIFIIPAIENRKFKNFMATWTFRSEVLVWFVFIIFFIYRFFLASPFISLLFLGLLLSLAWSSWKDLVAGLLFRIEKKVQTGDTIECNKRKGLVRKIGNRNILLEGSQNETIVIYHRDLLNHGYKILREKDRNNLLEIPLTKDTIEHFGGTEKIIKLLKTSPWSSGHHEPKFEIIDDSKILFQSWAISPGDKQNHKEYILHLLAKIEPEENAR